MATAPTITTKVVGVDHTQRALDRALEAADDRMDDGVLNIARAILLDARRNAPIGPRPKRSRTGPLAQSLRLMPTGRAMKVTSSEAHAHVQNSGGPVGRGGRISPARASWYFTKAVDVNEHRVVSEADAARDAAEKAFRKTERGSH